MKTTRQVAMELGLAPAALRHHIAAGNVAPPATRAGLLFLWTATEIEAARVALNQPGRRRARYVVRSMSEGGTDE